MAVWKSIDALHDFTYRSDHLDLLRSRTEWFSKMSTPFLVLWWIPTGHIPTVEEAKERLELLVAERPTLEAFTFSKRFDPPDSAPAL